MGRQEERGTFPSREEAVEISGSKINKVTCSKCRGEANFFYFPDCTIKERFLGEKRRLITHCKRFRDVPQIDQPTM